MIQADANFSGSLASRFAFRWLGVWVLLLMLTIPFPHPYLPDPGSLLAPATEAVTAFAGMRLLGLPADSQMALVSDSTGMYVWVGMCSLWAWILAPVWTWLDRKRANEAVLLHWGLVLLRYYLAAYLLSYGFNKVFKAQFYLPEPNTLYTPLGEVSRDLLFWSTMGASRAYTVFAGVMEVLAALLLLFRRTRLAGALLAFGILLNVVAVNFSFDISVKLFSSFLLFISLLLIAPDFRRLLAFSLGKSTSHASIWAPDFHSTGKRRIYLLAKTLVVCLLLFDSLAAYFRDWNFNDDTYPRPPLHGAYAVLSFTQNGASVPPDLRAQYRWKRAFIHREGFFIVQDMQDHMQDYALQIDTSKHKIHLKKTTDGLPATFHYEQVDGDLRLLGLHGNDSLDLHLRPLPWRQLPLLSKDFHWTSDKM